MFINFGNFPLDIFVIVINTFVIHATVHAGIALTLGELRSFSFSEFPSKVHPSS